MARNLTQKEYGANVWHSRMENKGIDTRANTN